MKCKPADAAQIAVLKTATASRFLPGDALLFPATCTNIVRRDNIDRGGSFAFGFFESAPFSPFFRPKRFLLFWLSPSSVATLA